MQKIIPHLWFDKNAEEAAAFYTSAFPESKLLYNTLLRNTPSGDATIVGFSLWGKEFMAINAGPFFTFNPAISFMVNFDPLFFGGNAEKQEEVARNTLNELWNKLSAGGKILMPLGDYPFSKLYGWVQDKYGLSWQLILTAPVGESRPTLLPSLLFTGENAGKAEEAINYYTAVFKEAQQGAINRRPSDSEKDKKGTLLFADFKLEDTWFAAMDSAWEHGFGFNEAISFLVTCADQQEIDMYWERLSAVPESEQCGWLKDKYGISWQISAAEMEKLLQTGTQEQIDRITRAFLPMRKIDIAEIRAAAER